MLASALSAISAVLPRRDLTSLGTSNSKKVALVLEASNKFLQGSQEISLGSEGI